MKVGPLMEIRADINITGMQDVSKGGSVAASPGVKKFWVALECLDP